ncbi:calcium-binding protein [Sphingosinicella sp. LHD-64]|uniref:calcium-binding protein n=1 Tax=Sphingosinicella sp. LHD-64 TaxID=3072139 RepID=UPI00280D9992|nr:calcium-binding protein [Sphingosinicella sp. LHD-64]MDQ8756115.1 calcium-binding protein [Sphingosinicella sp. LHD-64]
MAGHRTTVSGPTRDDQLPNSTTSGTGYRIGDNFVLTAGHIVFEWDRSRSSPDIIDGSNTIGLSYRGYAGQYLDSVNQLIAAGGAIPVNGVIEAGLARYDTVIIQGGGQIGSSADGLVVFLDDNDLKNPGAALNGAYVSREGNRTGHVGTSGSGSVTAVANGRLEYDIAANIGDSGGVYLLNFGGLDYVIGTHSSQVGYLDSTGNNVIPTGRAIGTYFTYQEWRDIDALLEEDQSGDITSVEPTNMVVGTLQGDLITGSYRPDILHGRDGNDFILDGDSLFDSVWANDTLIGGAGSDQFTAGAGNDTIWGGDEGDRTNGGADTDTVSYNASRPGYITINFHGDGSNTAITVNDAEGGTDTLHSIEKIIATEYSDYLNLSGLIPNGYTLTIDMGPGADVIANAEELSGRIVVNIDDQGTGTASTPDGGGTINLFNAKTQIIGSAYDDEITDLAVHDGLKRIDGGAGADVITVDGSDAMIFGGEDTASDILTGGDGNDMIVSGWSGGDEMYGGGGNDYLVVAGSGDSAEGGSGDDYIEVTAILDAYVAGGAGNDVIMLLPPEDGDLDITVEFGANDGHDTVIARDADGVTHRHTGRFDLSSLAKDDVTVIWDAQIIADNPPSGPGLYGTVQLRGDLVVRVNATGATILFEDVTGSNEYEDDPSDALSGPFYKEDGRPSFDIDLPSIELSEDTLSVLDFLHNYGLSPEVVLQTGSVAAYKTALEDYRDGVAGDPLDNQGTSGADDLRGSRGDDEIGGGDGDDNFHSSGGTDTIDGGNGADTLSLFGARENFIFTHEMDGTVSVQGMSGLEGRIRLTSVETVYFVTDNQSHATDDLVTDYNGTSGADLLVGTSNDDYLFGLAGNDTLRALDGNDVIEGGEGDDDYELGLGDDETYDEAGNDAYRYDPGDGDDAIFDETGTDYLSFGSGIDPADVVVTADGSDYVLSFDGMAGSVTIGLGVEEDYAIEEVRFADSTVWTDEDLYDMAFGQQLMGGGGEEFAHAAVWQPDEMASVPLRYGYMADFHCYVP